MMSPILRQKLTAYIEAGINIIYYRFDDRKEPSFIITQDVKVYSTSVPEQEPEVEEIPEPPKAKPPATPVAPVAPIEDKPEPQVAYPQQPYSAPAPIEYAPPGQVPPDQPILQKAVPVLSMEEISEQQLKDNMHNMLQYDDYDAGNAASRRKAAPAKVILCGSSKGGSGKTTTCLMSAYWYAKSHPTQKIAIADFDIIDGQIGITINKLTPTMQDYYKLYKNNHKDFTYLDNCKVKSDKFSPNVDFFLAPSQDIPTITNDVEFWNDIFQKLILNYDVVFFDSGIDYIGKPPISQLYKIADHIIITCNTSINSTKSVIKQFKTLSGARANNVFRKGDNILGKVAVVLTRMSDMTDVNSIVVQNLSSFAPIVAQFGQIDREISRIQWYQMWNIIESTPAIVEQLNNIIDF